MKKIVKDRLKRRVETQPLEYPSAGSTFRNPHINDYKDIFKKYNLPINKDGFVYAWGDYYHGIEDILTNTNSKLPVKIGNDASYPNELEIVVCVLGCASVFGRGLRVCIYCGQDWCTSFLFSSRGCFAM